MNTLIHLQPIMHTIVDANQKGLKLGLRELVQYKDLFLTLAYRDYRVKYAQTYLGLGWAFLQPAITMLIFVLVFGKAARVDTGSVPYPVFAIVGLSAWTYFSAVMSGAGTSLIGAKSMIQKIYFPRLIVPLQKAFVSLIDFGITFLFIGGIMIFYRFPVSENLIYLPLFILLNLVASLGVGIWISSLTVRYRDFNNVVPFLVRFGLYLTPVAYPSELLVNKIPEWAMIVYFMNPVAGIVEGFRYCFLGIPIQNNYIYISLSVIIVLFFSSLFYFKKVEKVAADIL